MSGQLGFVSKKGQKHCSSSQGSHVIREPPSHLPDDDRRFVPGAPPFRYYYFEAKNAWRLTSTPHAFS